MSRKKENTNDALTRKLTELRVRLDQAYEEFNHTLEPELIDASVYEINALLARSAYLLRTARQCGEEKKNEA